MHSPANPAPALLQAIRLGNASARYVYAVRRQQGQPAYLCGQAAYEAFRAELYRPSPRANAVALTLSLVGMVLTGLYKLFF